jgi:hypothetical protein
MICGKLPWSEAARTKDKQTVAALKKEYLDEPGRFIQWVTNAVAAAEALRDSFNVSASVSVSARGFLSSI